MVAGYDELHVAGLTLRGVSQGGLHTCLMVPELDLMFDVGALPKGSLRHETILVSHGHHDHLGSLPHLVSRRSLMRSAAPTVHVPQEVHEPLQAIFSAWSQIEDFELPVHLVPHAPEDRVQVRRDLVATCIRSVHRVPSLTWLVERCTRRLRDEFQGLEGAALRQLRQDGIEVTEPHFTPLLCVTGDTQIDLFAHDDRLRQCAVLVHEVTSWDDHRNVEQMRQWGHTHVDEMIEHCTRFEGAALVLVHRSLRHSKRQAEEIVRTSFPGEIRDRVHVFGK